MSSIAKTSISLSRKSMTSSRIQPATSRNIVFYHKATIGTKVINLLTLTMPSAEMPNMVQATIDEINSAMLYSNKKNVRLVSSSKGELIQGIDYQITSSTTIQLIGIYATSGADSGEIFIGTVTAAPISDMIAVSAKTITRSYTLPVGQTTLSLSNEYQVGVNPNDKVGAMRVYVNGALALRGDDYVEVDSGSGYGSTIVFNAAPATMPYSIVVDFGVLAITDNNAIGTIESLSGSVKKIADDLAAVAGTSTSDYFSASPSEVERRTFGDTVLSQGTRITALEAKTTLKQSVRFKGYAGYGGAGYTAVPYFTTQVANSGDSILAVSNSSSTGFRVTALKKCIVMGEASITGYASNAFYSQHIGWVLNPTNPNTAVQNIYTNDEIISYGGGGTSSGSNYVLSFPVSVHIELNVGDVLIVQTDGQTMLNAHLNLMAIIFPF